MAQLNTPEGLSITALHAMRRARAGEQVECTRWRHGTMESAKRALLDGGWMTMRSTPKGRKRYLVLTAKGSALMPAIEAYYMEKEEALRVEVTAMQITERMQAAGPEMFRALERIADQTHDEETRRYAREVLAKVGV